MSKGEHIDLNLNSKVLNEMLKLEVIDQHIYRANYISPSRSNGIYGGQIISQSMVAAQQTVQSDRTIHSLHCYFILAGDKSKPVIYHVENVRDGKTFTTRLVKALQNGRHIFSCILSFKLPEPCAYSFQRRMPKVKMPEELPMYEDVLKQTLKDNRVTDFQRLFISSYIQQHFTYNIKPANNNWMRLFLEDSTKVFSRYDIYIDDNRKNDDVEDKAKEEEEEEAEDDDHIKYWIKFKDTIASDNQDIQKWIAGYISDLFMLQSAMVKVPAKRYFPAMMVSLDHNMCFHCDFRVDEWFLYESWCPRYASNRALTLGRIWRRDGVLAVSMSQEGLFRVSSML